MSVELAPTEITALARILDELSYYQILHIEPGACLADVRAAFHATSRAFHPDANRHLEPEMRRAVERIATRLTEAYTVLRDPRRRKAYDASLQDGGSLRMQIVEAEAAAGKQASEELEGCTPNGRRFSTLAKNDLMRGDLKAGLRNLQMALTYEPENAHFKALIEDVRVKLEAERKARR